MRDFSCRFAALIRLKDAHIFSSKNHKLKCIWGLSPYRACKWTYSERYLVLMIFCMITNQALLFHDILAESLQYIW